MRFFRISSYAVKPTIFLCDEELVRLTQLVIEIRTLNYRTLIKLDIARLYSTSKMLFQSSIKGAFYRTELLTVYHYNSRDRSAARFAWCLVTIQIP
jgi:hypothetical protein